MLGIGVSKVFFPSFIRLKFILGVFLFHRFLFYINILYIFYLLFYFGLNFKFVLVFIIYWLVFILGKQDKTSLKEPVFVSVLWSYLFQLLSCYCQLKPRI
jgi:hypothetical protein